MDFSLSNEQRAWQMTARKFAEEEIKPITLELDEKPEAHDSFDWDIVEHEYGLAIACGYFILCLNRITHFGRGAVARQIQAHARAFA